MQKMRVAKRTRAALLVAAVLALDGTTARAQTGITDPVLRRLWTLGMDSSQTWQLAQTLFDSIGPRLTGTASLKAASDWIMQTYRGWGIDARTEQYGTWRGWRRGHSVIELVAPRVRTLEATLLGYSPGTGGKDVIAPTIILPLVKDSVAFARWLPNVTGKFVLISPAYPSCRPEDEWAAMARPESKARMDTAIVRVVNDWNARVGATGYAASFGEPTGTLGVALDRAGAAGVISSLLTNTLGEAWGTWSVFGTDNPTAPGIAMSCEDYGLLYRLTERREGARLRVNADARLLGDVPAFNTFGVIEGSEKPNEYVLLSAHLDSWDGSQGATDNGTGTIMMLEAIRLLKLAYPHPKRTLKVGHWSGEEQGMIGSRAFAYDHPEIVRAIAAGFNQDGGTGRIQRTWGAGLPDAGAHLERWLSKLPQEFQAQIRYTGVGSPAIGNTDHRSFTCYGAPFFLLAVLPWDNDTYTQHTNRDSFDKIVFDDLKENATIVAMLAYLASEDSTLINRERADLTAPAGGGGGGGQSGGGTRDVVSRAELGAQLYPWHGGGSSGPQRDERGWVTTCPRAPRFYNDSSRIAASSKRP